GRFADPVDGRPARRLERLLDPAQALVHGAPAGVDQVDEDAEVVDARAALGEKLRLDPLELTGDGLRLAADAVAHGLAHLVRQRCLEPGGGGRERLDLAPRAFERGLYVGGVRLASTRLQQPLARPVESTVVHGGDDSVSGG